MGDDTYEAKSASYLLTVQTAEPEPVLPTFEDTVTLEASDITVDSDEGGQYYSWAADPEGVETSSGNAQMEWDSTDSYIEAKITYDGENWINLVSPPEYSETTESDQYRSYIVFNLDNIEGPGGRTFTKLLVSEATTSSGYIVKLYGTGYSDDVATLSIKFCLPETSEEP